MTHNFQIGDIVETTLDLPHATRETLPAGTQGLVTGVYPNGLLAIDLLDRDEHSARAVRAAAVVYVDRAPDITVAWNLIAALKRTDPSVDLDALRNTPALLPQEV